MFMHLTVGDIAKIPIEFNISNFSPCLYNDTSNRKGFIRSMAIYFDSLHTHIVGNALSSRLRVSWRSLQSSCGDAGELKKGKKCELELEVIWQMSKPNPLRTFTDNFLEFAIVSRNLLAKSVVVKVVFDTGNTGLPTQSQITDDVGLQSKSINIINQLTVRDNSLVSCVCLPLWKGEGKIGIRARICW